MLMYYKVNKQYLRTLLKYDENIRTLHNLKRYNYVLDYNFLIISKSRYKANTEPLTVN